VGIAQRYLLDARLEFPKLHTTGGGCGAGALSALAARAFREKRNGRRLIRLGLRRIRIRKAVASVALMFPLVSFILLGGGGFVQVISQNGITPWWVTGGRWEPSSSACPTFSCPAGSGWVHSWIDFVTPPGVLTSSWTGSGWVGPTPHYPVDTSHGSGDPFLW